MNKQNLINRQKKPWTVLGVFGRIAAGGTAGLLLLLTLFCGLVGSLTYVGEAASESWPSVNGKVTQSEVLIEDGSTDSFEMKVEYAYTVDDVAYTGDEIDMGYGGGLNKEEAREQMLAYRVGATVPVYYADNNPEDCVLQPGVVDGGALTCIVGFATCCFVFAVPLLWLTFRPRGYMKTSHASSYPQATMPTATQTPIPQATAVATVADPVVANPFASPNPEMVSSNLAAATMQSAPAGNNGMALATAAYYAAPEDAEPVLKPVRNSRSPSHDGMDNSVLGGLGLMLFAVVWFVAGLAAGYIFFYPPILFIAGIVSCFKGMMAPAT